MEGLLRNVGWCLINTDILLYIIMAISSVFVLKHRPWARKTFMISLGTFVFFSTVPIGHWIVAHMENRFSKPATFPSDVDGVIFLGGTFDRPITLARRETAYNPAGGRLIAIAQMMIAHPNLKFIFTGGGQPLGPGDVSEAELTHRELKALGLPAEKMIYESKSRTTIENAKYTAELLKPQPHQKWLLVTSAFHMPRSVGLFEKEGFHVIAYPVDYHTKGTYEMMIPLGPLQGFHGWHYAIREVMGMLFNYLFGRSNTLYPGEK